MNNGEVKDIDNPVDAPDPVLIDHWEEAICEATIMAPRQYYDAISNIGENISQEFLDEQVMLKFHIPLTEMIGDFFDVLKSSTSGYASVEYKVIGFRPTELVKVVFHLNGEAVDALTFLVYKDKARKFAAHYATKLRDILPRQQFAIAIQAKIGPKVVAREDVKAYR